MPNIKNYQPKPASRPGKANKVIVENFHAVTGEGNYDTDAKVTNYINEVKPTRGKKRNI